VRNLSVYNSIGGFFEYAKLRVFLTGGNTYEKTGVYDIDTCLAAFN
jgi:hypothetical protein